MLDHRTEHRKRAAIMFTDMVGCSALAQRNEKLALNSVPEGRKKIAQGVSLGFRAKADQAPEGRKKTPRLARVLASWTPSFWRPFRALSIFRFDPGLVPWAIIYRPAGA